MSAGVDDRLCGLDLDAPSEDAVDIEIEEVSVGAKVMAHEVDHSDTVVGVGVVSDPVAPSVVADPATSLSVGVDPSISLSVVDDPPVLPSVEG